MSGGPERPRSGKSWRKGKKKRLWASGLAVGSRLVAIRQLLLAAIFDGNRRGALKGTGSL